MKYWRFAMTRGTALLGPMLAVVPLVGLLTGCGTQGAAVSRLEAVPGAMASYPGSIAIGGHGAVKGQHTLWSDNPPMILGTFCADASQRDVSRWFASELGRDGWKAVSNPVGTTDIDVEATEQWNRGRRLFTLHLMTPAYVGRLSAGYDLKCLSGYKVTVQ